jgi:hypothetical protein
MQYIATVKHEGTGEIGTVGVNSLDHFWHARGSDSVYVDFGQNGESEQTRMLKYQLELVSIEKVS